MGIRWRPGRGVKKIRGQGDSISFPCRGSKKLPFFLRFRLISRPLPSKIVDFMARVCQVTGKQPISGHSVSHSNIKTKRRFLPNLHTKRFFLAEEDKWIRLKVSSEGLRTINKKGLYQVVKQLRAEGQKI
jgi:large subunit ribosomal protein L28